MKTIAWAHYNPISHRLELSQTEKTGFKPLVYRDSKPQPVYSREIIERMARELGWTPPIDQQEAALEALRKHPLGVDFGTLCAVVGRSERTVKAIVQPLRKAGLVRIWPRKGPGAVWYATEHEHAVLIAWAERRDALRAKENERAKSRMRKERAFYSDMPLNNVPWRI